MGNLRIVYRKRSSTNLLRDIFSIKQELQDSSYCQLTKEVLIGDGWLGLVVTGVPDGQSTLLENSVSWNNIQYTIKNVVNLYDALRHIEDSDLTESFYILPSLDALPEVSRVSQFFLPKGHGFIN